MNVFKYVDARSNKDSEPAWPSLSLPSRISLHTTLSLGLWTPHTCHLLSVSPHPRVRSFPTGSLPMMFFHLEYTSPLCPTHMPHPLCKPL